MRLTQKEIARRLGVSLITVSRALNSTGYVSKELKSRILEFATSESYVPHKASQVLVRNKLRKIALFSSSLPSYFWHDIRRGVEIAAEQIHAFNYQVHYHMTDEGDSESYIRILREEINSGLDAVGLVNQRKYDMEGILRRISEAGVPFVTFNVDAPASGRLCYIGSDYQSGGRLAGEFIGKSLQFKKGASVLVINLKDDSLSVSRGPDINGERLKGFTAVMSERFPEILVRVHYITTSYLHSDSQIEDILREERGRVDAVYLIPAFNSMFLEALEKLEYKTTITVLHDIDSSASHHLESHLLSAVIYQNPILQGYYTVKTLEHVLESNQRTETSDIEIVHNLILSENRNLHRNHYAVTQLIN